MAPLDPMKDATKPMNTMEEMQQRQDQVIPLDLHRASHVQAPVRSGKGVGLLFPVPDRVMYEASLVCLDAKKESWAASTVIRVLPTQADLEADHGAA